MSGREIAITGAIGIEYGFVEFFAPVPKSAGWTGGILWDNAVRDAMRLHSKDGRHVAGEISDYFTLVPQVQVLVLDSILVPMATDRLNVRATWEMSAMNLQALALTGLTTRLGYRLIRRERPARLACKTDSDYGDCSAGPYASFPSGHTAASFTAAGLACAHHANLDLYGGGVPDALGCIVPALMAVGDGVTRVMADRHWSTDVLSGAVVGLVYGYGVPYFVHYHYRRFFEKKDDGNVKVRWAMAPLAQGDALGVQGFGTF